MDGTACEPRLCYAATLDAAAPAGEPKHACVPGSKGAMCAGCPINPGSLGA